MALVATGLFSLPNSHAFPGVKYLIFFLVCVFGFRADFFEIGFSCKIWKSSASLFLCACAVLFLKKIKVYLKINFLHLALYSYARWLPAGLNLWISHIDSLV